MNEQERFEVLEKQVDALYQVVGRLLYQVTSRYVLPFPVNDELVATLVEAFPEKQEASDATDRQ